MFSGVTEQASVTQMSLSGRPALEQFLSTLWPAGFGEQWCLFWGFPSKRSYWANSINDELLDHLLIWGETEDVYIGCGLRGENSGPNHRGDRDAVTAIPGVWIDLDIAGDAHRKRNLPPTEGAALELLEELGLSPTLLVHSGHGLQAWWVFKEPWILDSEEERTKAERLTNGWCDTLRLKAKAHGWDADQVGDLARVMRLPGLWNRKGIPKRTAVLRCEPELVVNPSDFDPYLSTVESVPAAVGLNLKWTFVLDPVHAQPSAEKFATLLDQDYLFKASWIHARTDIQNQSLSSYDLSLATRAFAAGWHEQEVVNLIIAHRRKYKDKTDSPDKISRRDYFERTLSRAITGAGQETRTEAVEALKAENATPVAGVDDSGKDHGTIPTRRFHLTDTGNAEHFTNLYGDLVRYDQRRRRWLVWKMHRWCPDEDAEIRRLAKDCARDRLKKAAFTSDEDKRKEEVGWALKSESRSRIDAFIALAQSEKPISDPGDTWDFNPMLLCVQNGVVDLRTGQLRDGAKEDRLTMSASVPFHIDAAAPRWERFLQEVFGGDQDLVEFLQRAIGYSLTGETTEQCLFLCYGMGANGKSTFVNTLQRLLGNYAWNMGFSTIESNQRASIPNDLAALVGKRFVIASETNDGTRLNEARVKALTGCDIVTARFLHQELFEFVPVTKVWLCVNHKPIVRDDSHAFWRRIRLIPFQQQFPGDKLLGKELSAEASGILAWAVRGCMEWQRLGGLHPPKVVMDATAAYALDSDPLNEFLEDACKLDPTAETGAQDLYNTYRQWAMKQGMTHEEWLSGTAFGRKMKTRFETRRTRAGKVYLGVKPCAV